MDEPSLEAVSGKSFDPRLIERRVLPEIHEREPIDFAKESPGVLIPDPRETGE